MAKRRNTRRPRRRGISIGTILIIVICAGAIALGAGILSRISGDMGEITLDPKMITEPLAMLAQGITDPDPSGLGDLAAATEEQPPLAQIIPSTEPEPTATPEPTPPPSRSLSLTATGIVGAGNELRLSGRDDTGAYDYSPIFAPIAGALSGADLSITTLRATVSNTAGSYDAYLAPLELAQGLKDAGINLISFASDRVMDHGIDSAIATRDLLRDASISTTGVYSSAEDRAAAAIHDLNGVRVGVLSFTTGISTNGKKAATEADIAQSTRVWNPSATPLEVAALRQQGAELVIVLANWGTRNDNAPTNATKEIAAALANAGADIILGTGPNAVHEFERRIVNDSDGASREVFIAYSLGHLVVDDTRDTAAIAGVVLHLGIEWDAQARRATYTDNWYMPTWIMRYKDSGGVFRYHIVPSGVETQPDNMLDSIYVNMKKTYQSMITRLGTDKAQPIAVPR